MMISHPHKLFMWCNQVQAQQQLLWIVQRRLVRYLFLKDTFNLTPQHFSHICFIFFSAAIQSLISDACQKAVEKVEEKNKLILLRLTENVEGMRKEIIELKKAVSHNNATIIPSKPFANIEDFLNFEKTILEDIDKFSLLVRI